MTDLRKPIKRMTRTPDRDYVVTLYPGGVIGIREKRRRKEFTTTIGAVYIMAVRAQVERERKEKATRKRRPQVRRGLFALGGGR